MTHELRLLVFLASPLLLLVRPSCGLDADHHGKDSAICSEPGEPSQSAALLQKSFNRQQAVSSVIAPGETASLGADEFCTWEPDDECQKGFSHKGFYYEGCSSLDHPTPWCSHDSVHIGAWSRCIRTCVPTEQPPVDIEPAGWVNEGSYYIGQVGANKGYGGGNTHSHRVKSQVTECTAPLVRFAAINDINAVRPIMQGHDPFFPAAETSIAAPGENCGDAAHNIFESCSKYNDWESMDTISKRRGFSFSVFNPTTRFPAYEDVRQGQLGTCYFLAAIASIAYRTPGVIQDMFTRREYWDQGIISTKWLINGVESVVEVDKTIPASGGRPYFATLDKYTGAWWPAILEKTWSKIYGSYKAAEAGWWAVAASAITRAPTVTYLHSKVKGDRLWQVLLTASKNKWPMGAGTSESHYGLAGGHAYSVLEAWEDRRQRKLVKMRNPWHSNYYRGSQPNPDGDDSGVFTMTFDEFEVAFYSNSVAKVAPSYEVTPVRVAKMNGVIQGVFSFSIRSNKWFSVSMVWPNHRMLCKMPNPSYVLAVQKKGSNSVYTPEPSASTSNAVYVEIPSSAEGGGSGDYTVVLSATFPVDTFIDEIYMNVYAEESVQMASPQLDYANLVLGMVGPSIQGVACDNVMINNRGLWRANRAKLMYGVPTYDSYDGKYFAYYVADEDQWFMIGNSKWGVVSQGRRWSYAKMSKNEFVCGCQDSVNGVGPLGGVGCDMVKSPNVKFGNVRCDTDVKYTLLAQAYCPVTCGVDVCQSLPARPRPLPDCIDTSGYSDEQGYSCLGWRGLDCTSATEQFRYTQSGENDLLRNCRATCRLCQPATK